jgi:hypothetical protein
MVSTISFLCIIILVAQCYHLYFCLEKSIMINLLVNVVQTNSLLLEIVFSFIKFYSVSF